MKRLRSKDCAGGFSLVELLVVMAIIGLLMALLLPAFAQARQRADRVKCLSNLRQIGIAFHSFAHDHGNHFPMEVPASAGGSRDVASLTNSGSADLAHPHFQPIALDLVTPAMLICPSDTRRPALSFDFLRNTNVSYFVALRARFGQATSILAGDRNLTNDWLGAASTYQLDANSMVRWTQELHRYKGNLLFADGHVEQWQSMVLFAAAGSGLSPVQLVLPATTTPLAQSQSGILTSTAPWAVVASKSQPSITSGASSRAAQPSIQLQARGVKTGMPDAKDSDHPSKAREPSTASQAIMTAQRLPPTAAAPANPLAYLVAMVGDIVRTFYWLLLLLLALAAWMRFWLWLRQRQTRADRLRARDERTA